MTTLVITHRCGKCGTLETTSYFDKKTQTTKPMWYNKEGRVLCKKCYRKYYIGPQRIQFKGKRITNVNIARTGVCNLCRAVVNEVNGQINQLCQRVDFHHERYDEASPTANTLEVCHSCHSKESWGLKQMRGNQYGLYFKQGRDSGKVCIRCGSRWVRKEAKITKKTKGTRQRYKCVDCRRTWLEEIPNE